MKLEKAIKQTKAFNNPLEKAIVNLIYTSSWLHAQQKIFFEPFAITAKQYNILRILRGAKEPISTADIRNRMLDKMSDASRIVDRLEKKGLVIKNTSAEDQRKVDITLHEAGRKLLLEIDKVVGQWQKNFSSLTEEEAAQLSTLLDKMRK